jgi:hypothetical protein
VRLPLGRTVRVLGFLFATSQLVCVPPQGHALDEFVVYSHSLVTEGAIFQIEFAQGAVDLPRTRVIEWVQKAAQAVALYYGRFPVTRVRILIVPVAGKRGVLQGTTWGGREGFPAYLRIRLGELTTSEELEHDWIITHELVHTAMVSLPDDQAWLEEGLATYIEPIARVQVGELTAESIWGDMARGMPKGEPGVNDRGLDQTPTWGRTYWGGALFCLMADIEIRRETGNHRGLQDALRAIVAAGGTIDKDWPLPRVLKIGDEGTGTRVLEQMNDRWSDTPVSVDLTELWKELGVRAEGNTVTFDKDAPLASIRAGITESATFSGRSK